jgi:hypothetical protein
LVLSCGVADHELMAKQTITRHSLKFGAHDGAEVVVPSGTERIYLPLQWQAMVRHARFNGNSLEAINGMKGGTEVEWSATKTAAFPIPYGLNKRTQVFVEDRQSGF